MKPLISVAMTVCLTFSALAESDQTVWVGSTNGLSGSVSSIITGGPPGIPLTGAFRIKSGTRGTIRYFNSAPFFLSLGGRIDVDLNADGTNDFNFGGGGVATGSFPGSSWLWFDVGGADSNQVSAVSNYVRLEPFNLAGNIRGIQWSNPGDRTGLITFYANGLDPGWEGRIGRVGVGYLPVRFQAADGIHYGWIRMQLRWDGLFIGFAYPAVLDWAYETRPNVPIRAGALSSSQQKEFVIDFTNPDGTRHEDNGHVSSGSCVLVGNVLRYELHIGGAFTHADLRAVGRRKLRTGLFSNLTCPPIGIHLPCHRQTQDPETGLWTYDCEGDLTVFFGDIKLSALQIALLKRGQLELSIGRDDVIGHIRRLGGTGRGGGFDSGPDRVSGP